MKRKNNLALHVRLAMTILLLIGAWLVLASLALNYGSGGAALSNTIMGILIIILALVGMRSPLDASPICFVIGLVGLWLAASPFVLGYNNQILVMANNLWIGLVTVILAAFSVGEAQGLEQPLESH